MRPKKILYVDDEAMSLKYFERLISPLAPVLVALSVEEGKKTLQEQGADIAVLVSDQRMPGARGNELLSYARDHYPHIVRLMTTAYSELGEAIEAINQGEIYRYITKPWDLESLRADLKNALELATLRGERDGLLSEKMMVRQQSLLASRMTQTALLCAGFVRKDYERSLQAYLMSVLKVGCKSPEIDWRSLDHSELMQFEAQRGIAVGQLLAKWQTDFEASGVDRFSTQALHVLAKLLPEKFELKGESLVVRDANALTWTVAGPAQQMPEPASVAWLAWLLWSGQQAQLERVADAWQIQLAGVATAAPLPGDWLANCIEQISEAAMV